MYSASFAAAFAAVQYSRDTLPTPDDDTLADLLHQIHEDPSLRNHRDYDATKMPTIRKVAADALRDAGRDGEADLLADHTQRVRIAKGYKVKPAHEQFSWPGGGEIVHFVDDGDHPLCANCANALDPEGDDDVQWSGLHEEGAPIECSDCNHVIHALYGDPENPDAEQYAAAMTAVHYSREHTDVNSLAAALPFAATRASDNGVLHPHRAALADALWEAGRDDEAQVAADPAKHLRLVHEPEGWYGVEHDDTRGDHPLHPTHGNATRDTRQYLNTAHWTTQMEDGRSLDETPIGLDSFTPDAVARAHHDIEKFKGKLSPEARQELDEDRRGRGGHDLWLSRNGHGAGFSYGDYEHGDELHAAAESLGEQYVEVEPADEDTTHLHLTGGSE